MWCANSFHIWVHEWRIRKWCETKCNSLFILGSLTSTFLPNSECEWRAWLMLCHNSPE